VAGFAVVVQARLGDDAGDEAGSIAGVTGQRQAISFQMNDAGRPRSLATVLWAQCPGQREQKTGWTPSDGAPVPFRLRDGRLRVRETKPFEYANGVSGFASGAMDARVKGDRIDGRMRAVWRFTRHGRTYAVCDSGHVPFAAGHDSKARLAGVAPVREPWTLYPVGPSERLPLSFARLRFAGQVDDTCTRTYWALRHADRQARRRGGGYWRVRAAYVRAHVVQLVALRRLGQPPDSEDVYRRWLANFGQRVDLEGRQLVLLRRGDLAEAASLDARIATLKARGNAEGLEFGLRRCVSTGPTGAPKG
jgi:hypothetical protein